MWSKRDETNKKKICYDYQEIPMSMMVRLYFIQRKKKKVFTVIDCDILLV